jgi:hypothetical protein
MSNAEKNIKDFLVSLKTKFYFTNEDELVIIPKELMKIVEKQYEFIGQNYMGYISELITKIKYLEDKYEKQQLLHELELLKEQNLNKLLKKDIEIKLLEEQNTNKLLKKDIEIKLLEEHIHYSEKK